MCVCVAAPWLVSAINQSMKQYFDMDSPHQSTKPTWSQSQSPEYEPANKASSKSNQILQTPEFIIPSLLKSSEWP